LDEATSALDNKSEKEVQMALDNVSAGVTTIIIAHRLSTIINSDKIIVLGEKRALEEGTHNELLQKGGEYFNLFKHSCNTVDSLSLAHKGSNENIVNMQTNKNDQVKEEKVLQKETGLIKENDKNNIVDVEELTLEQKKAKEEEEEKIQDEKFSMARKRLMGILGKEKCIVFAAIIGALLNGAVFPVYGILLGMAIDALSYLEVEKIAEKTFLVSMYFLILAGGSGLANFLQK